MKKIFTRVAMTAMMLVTAIAVQAQDALTVDGTESYYNLLVDGTDYVLPGTDGSWYCQPGFFTHKEGDVWTFNANSEANFAYCITLDEGLKYVDVTLLNAQGGEGVGDASTATWDANKALWVNGSEGIGFPSFATNKINWTGGHDVAVPMIADGIYEIAGVKYGFKASGAMITGWGKIYGKWYYFASGGAMQKAKWVDTNYYVDKDGVMVTSAYIQNGTRYYWVNSSGKYTKTYTSADEGYPVYKQSTGERTDLD